MKAVVPISLKRLASKKLSAVQNGQLSREKAEQMLKGKLRYSSKLRADLIAGMTESYDEDTAEALRYFRLI